MQTLLKFPNRFASILLGIGIATISTTGAAVFHVAPSGSDTNLGAENMPFGTLEKARLAARALAGREPVNVIIGGGTYYLADPLVFTPEDSGTKTAPIIYKAAQGAKPVISGGALLALKWQPFKDGIMQASVPPGIGTDQLFINGRLQHMARYPNFNPDERIFDGYAKDAFSKERAARWKDPAGGYIHAMHSHLWGDYHYRITGRSGEGGVIYEGGWQNNRQMGMHDSYRFVENIFEELDAPGEWYLDGKTHTLYFLPPTGLDLASAKVEVVRLRNLVEFRGAQGKPVSFISFRGLSFNHSARTFMDNREPLLRSDWTTYRGGAIFFNGAEDCDIEGATLENLGGNGIFVNNYNRRISIRDSIIRNISAGGISFVGDPAAVRSPLFEYNQVQDLSVIDLQPGPKTENYPADCLVENCLITRTSEVEKQTAPVQIEMSRRITLRHCSIYDVPRAGINIGSGCWGGHVIEFCDVFDTVQETGDHGSFNSWGRDRFWRPDISETNEWLKREPTLPLLDVVEPITIRNSRWRCDHGWDIDLDDGSSNYIITNNLMFHGGLKLREGFNRIVENNIMVDNQLSPHVWYDACGDVFRRNIVFRDGYGEARMHKQPWGSEMDFNLVHVPAQSEAQPAKGLQSQSKRDRHSIAADARFIDPASGNYQVNPGSPALALGFRNFAMNQFGVTSPALKAIARTPLLPGNNGSVRNSAARDVGVRTWLTAKARNITGQSEMSAYGTSGESGILLVEVPQDGFLAGAGIRKDDVIVSLNDQPVSQLSDLVRLIGAIRPGQEIFLGAIRAQKNLTIRVRLPEDVAFGSAPVVLQAADHAFILKASDCEIVGTGGAVVEGLGGNVGNWKSAADEIRWQAMVRNPGRFKVSLVYALDGASAGSAFELSIGDRKLSGKPAVTGGWRNYQTVELGFIEIEKTGPATIHIKPVAKPGEAVMNLHSVSLVPVK